MNLFAVPQRKGGTELNIALKKLQLGKPAEVLREHVQVAEKQKFKHLQIMELRDMATYNEHVAGRHQRLRGCVQLLETFRALAGLPIPQRHSHFVRQMPRRWNQRAPRDFYIATRGPDEVIEKAVVVENPDQLLGIDVTMHTTLIPAEVSARLEAVALARLDGRALIEWWAADLGLGVVCDWAVLDELIDLCAATGKKDNSFKTRVTFL